jgi:hypothetical protein
MCGINKQKLGTSQMTSFSLPSISGLFSSFLSGLYSSDHQKSTSELTMGPNEWKEVANIDVQATDVPQSLLEATDELSKTHILCCAPKNMSISKLYEIEGKDTSALSQADQEKNPKTYWFWMSRETTHKYLNFDQQKEALTLSGYDVPTRLEAMIAIYAAKKLEGTTLLSGQDDATRCKSTKGKSFDVIGGDASATFCAYNPDHWSFIGVSSVLRG